MNSKELKQEVLQCIEQRLGLEHIEALEESYYELPIFLNDDEAEMGLGLDSIDAIEIIIAIKEKYNVKISDEDMKVLKSIASIAEFLEEKINR